MEKNNFSHENISRSKNIEDKPQDGRYSIFLSNERVDVRSSFTNRLWRECRNETSEVQLNWPLFDDLGLRPEAYQI